ncbi:MAG: hypothetical protein KGV57_04865 [Fusobacterium sp.]|nr:hypothetical protein [Fusobacterium sp.]
MKRFKRKLLVIISVMFMGISFNSSAGLFGGSGGGALKKIIGILNKIQKTQTGMDLTQIEILLKEVEQIQNQVKSLENEARQLKGLGERIKQGNIDEILDIVINLEQKKNETELTLRENMAKLDNISKWFSLNQNEFKQGNEWEQNQVKTVEERIEKMRDDVKKATAKLNAKSRNGYSLRKDDLNRLKDLIKNINNADGEVAVLQALGHLTGQTNQILIDIKDILRDQNNLVANTNQAFLTEEDTKRQRAKEEEENNERIAENFKKESEKLKRKKLKLEFGKVD